ATASTTSSTRAGGVTGTLPRIRPVAGSRASSSPGSEVSLVGVLIWARLSRLQPAGTADRRQPPGQLGLGIVGRVEALGGHGVGQQLLRGEVSGSRVRVVVAAALLAGAGTGAQPARHCPRPMLAHVALGRRE